MAGTAQISSAELRNGVANCKLQNPTWRPNLMRHATECLVQTQVVVREICENTCCVSTTLLLCMSRRQGCGSAQVLTCQSRHTAAWGNRSNLQKRQSSLTHAPPLVMAVGVPPLRVARGVCTPAGHSSNLEAMPDGVRHVGATGRPHEGPHESSIFRFTPQSAYLAGSAGSIITALSLHVP